MSVKALILWSVAAGVFGGVVSAVIAAVLTKS